MNFIPEKWLSKITLYPLIILLLNLLGCTPMIHPARTTLSSAKIHSDVFVTADGTQLPLKTWKPQDQAIDSIIIALHGFNDYSHFFHQPGRYFSQHNTLSYAYDQRGFGNSPNRGLWAGVDTYISDLEYFVHLIKDKHPSKPIYLLGESMGGAIVISTVAQSSLPIEGIILSAPAVWTRETMPWYQNALLWTLSHTVPWMNLSGGNLGIKPSDNIEMLRALGKDPLIIKTTRVETIYGLVNLMDNAFAMAANISANTLLLYGEKDQLIPMKPTQQFLNTMISSKNNHAVIAFYKNGYHMLLRDLQASVFWDDIKAWISTSKAPLPSGADKRAEQLFNK